MKRESVLSFSLIITLGVSASACDTPTGASMGASMGAGTGTSEVALGSGDLTDEMAAHLTLLREEEKLARDVYARLGARFDVPAFARIGASEQRHFDAIGAALAAYGLDDPAAGLEVGRFADSGLQGLYDTLAPQGEGGLVEALSVGALIEETDLEDLEAALALAPPPDVEAVYSGLAAGSRNHLRAYTRLLAAQGVQYVPQVLDPQAYQAILSSPHERGAGCGGTCDGAGGCGRHGGGRGMGQGQGQCQGQCQGQGMGQGQGQGQGMGQGQGRGRGRGRGQGG